MCGTQSNGLDSVASLSLPPDTYNAYSSDASERGFHLREDSQFSSAEIDHDHLSSTSSVKHARPLPTGGSVPTIEQNFFPQRNIGILEDPGSLHGFDEELEPLWDSINGSRTPPTSLQLLPGTHSRDLPLARGIQESTNSDTIDSRLSTDRVFDAQYYLRLDEAQRKTDDPMQLDCPFERKSKSELSLNLLLPKLHANTELNVKSL